MDKLTPQAPWGKATQRGANRAALTTVQDDHLESAAIRLQFHHAAHPAVFFHP